MGMFLLYLVCGLAAIIFSILAWRLKDNTLWIIGMSCTGVIVLINLYSWEYAAALLESRDVFTLLIFASFMVLPGIFLYKAKNDQPGESFDGSTASGAVTEEYLDEVINAPDEDIDFEDGLDLR